MPQKKKQNPSKQVKQFHFDGSDEEWDIRQASIEKRASAKKLCSALKNMVMKLDENVQDIQFAEMDGDGALRYEVVHLLWEMDLYVDTIKGTLRTWSMNRDDPPGDVSLQPCVRKLFVDALGKRNMAWLRSL